MNPALASLTDSQKKTKLPQIKPGDTVRVHQLIREGSKSRVQVFEGVVIRLSRPNEIGARIVVRKISSGVGVEKSWLLHSPNLSRVEVIRRGKVRRAYLTYLRERRGKSARLIELGFDRDSVNAADGRTAAEILAEETPPLEAVEDDTIEVAESTDDLAREEETNAAQADPSNDKDETLAGGADEDDALDDAIEVQDGLDRAEKNSTN